jgi:NitT/TauT family transport system permease protein
MRKRSHVSIYASTRHLVVTFLILVLPFAFFFYLSSYAKVAQSALFVDLGLSFFRILVSYCIAALLAWLLAVLFYNGRRAAIALPFFDVMQSFPTFAALPVAVYLWGATNVTIIFFLILTIMWPILFSIISSLKLIRQDWQEVTQVYNLRGLKYLTYFLIPASLPGFITGSIIGLGEGWEAVIATEIIVGAREGLGNFFQTFSNNVTVTALGIFGFLLLIFVINKFVWLSLLEWSHKRMEL